MISDVTFFVRVETDAGIFICLISKITAEQGGFLVGLGIFGVNLLNRGKGILKRQQK